MLVIGGTTIELIVGDRTIIEETIADEIYHDRFLSRSNRLISDSENVEDEEYVFSHFLEDKTLDGNCQLDCKKCDDDNPIPSEVLHCCNYWIFKHQMRKKLRESVTIWSQDKDMKKNLSYYISHLQNSWKRDIRLHVNYDGVKTQKGDIIHSGGNLILHYMGLTEYNMTIKRNGLEGMYSCVYFIQNKQNLILANVSLPKGTVFLCRRARYVHLIITLGAY